MNVVFILPQSGPLWDHRSPENEGIAGSETAVIEITQRLARRGHKVSVYANVPDDVCDDGPIHWGRFQDVLDGKIDISLPGAYWLCRSPALADWFPGNRPDQKLFLRCDDLHYGQIGTENSLTTARQKKLDHILLMSGPHRDFFKSVYPFLDLAKTSTLGCGINSERIASLPQVERDPFRLMWCSSPDRGLQHAISILHQLRAKDLRFTLHVYYGWNGVDAAIARDPNCHQAELKRTILGMDQTGITWHGRVPKAELLEGHQLASFLVYPCTFAEAGVVTVQEAQALGDIVICPPTFGLAEKVKNGVFIEGDPADPLIQSRYIDTVLWLASHREAANDLRDEARNYALDQFGYEQVVDHHEFLMGSSQPSMIKTFVAGGAKKVPMHEWDEEAKWL